uniref:ABM domain-containing protein n=1 Tax=Hemiselmis andersenii TaxID=464988 RepID=A0A6U2CM87_HEMAN|mmetsp:Transcript_20360/g.47012  ORF Transcript_20360/g.47012 Transcript_20360/m.47012 type:complete len:135 (+) Transcript_20360:92-496(+)
MATGYEGKTQITIMVSVPAEQEKAGDEIFERHKKWMQSTHGPWGLLFYTVCKNKELSAPLDQSSAPTGKIIFTLTEVYASPEGLQKHWSSAPTDIPDVFKDFAAFCTTEGHQLMLMHGAPVVRSLYPGDCAFKP